MKRERRRKKDREKNEKRIAKEENGKVKKKGGVPFYPIDHV